MSNQVMTDFYFWFLQMQLSVLWIFFVARKLSIYRDNKAIEKYEEEYENDNPQWPDTNIKVFDFIKEIVITADGAKYPINRYGSKSGMTCDRTNDVVFITAGTDESGHCDIMIPQFFRWPLSKT